jgi:HK97 family phage portal protein
MPRKQSRYDNLLSKTMVRMAVPRSGLGNLIQSNTGGGGKGPQVATRNVSWQSPGQPQILDMDAQAFGEDAYLNQVYVMRCVRTIANAISGLEFRAGLDPEIPANHDPSAPLAQLLGPATPQAPGGPCPETSSRAFWAWTICQYIVYGRWAWECQLDKKQIVALWPLVASCVSAVPSQGGARWFDSYVYTTPMDGDVPMKPEQMIYAWRPSLGDWRVPETVLSAAKLPIYIAKGMDRYMAKLLENDMVASTLVVTPPFEEPSARRAWQEQFNTTFSGIDNKGKTVFAEADYDEDDTSGKPLVQIEKIAQTAVEAELITIGANAKADICIALGVAKSLLGDAAQRIYANADSEYKSFWTLTVMDILTELQDHVNTKLAPRLGDEVGWFDLTRVAALKPESIFMPPMIGDVINYGVADAAQVANVLGIPAADAAKDEDSDTIELGEESSKTGADGGRSARSWKGTRVTKHQLLNARVRWENKPINSYNWDAPFRASDWLVREHIDIVPTAIEVRSAQPVRSAEAMEILERVERARSKIEINQRQLRIAKTAELVERTRQVASDVRALHTITKVGKSVHDKLSENYPESVLDWVDTADWEGPKSVPMDKIDMARRPGGRDQAKVQGIANGIASGDVGASAPVMLVKTPEEDQYQVCDGYHRLLAHKRLGHSSVKAFVGTVHDEGTYDKDKHKEMHDAKLNRMAKVEGPGREKVQWVGLDGKLHDDLTDEEVNKVNDRNAWLPIEGLTTQNCTYCSNPAAIIHASADGTKSIATCLEHAGDAQSDLQRSDFTPTIAPYSGTDFEHWVHENEAGLIALAEEEEMADADV